MEIEVHGDVFSWNRFTRLKRGGGRIGRERSLVHVLLLFSSLYFTLLKQIDEYHGRVENGFLKCNLLCMY